MGDIMAPLLRVVDMKRATDHGTMHRVLTRLLYVPLQNKHFDTIEIIIMTDKSKSFATEISILRWTQTV